MLGTSMVAFDLIEPVRLEFPYLVEIAVNDLSVAMNKNHPSGDAGKTFARFRRKPHFVE